MTNTTMQWVKPLQPSDIPAGTYAVWDSVANSWTFLPLPVISTPTGPISPTGATGPTV
jgi:hypothetical protein